MKPISNMFVGLLSIALLSGCSADDEPTQTTLDQPLEITLNLTFDGPFLEHGFGPWTTATLAELGWAEWPLPGFTDTQLVSLPLVYVDGKLAGLVPGVIALPLSTIPVTVEIGFGELQGQPLMSFQLALDDLERGTVDGVVSVFSAFETAEWSRSGLDIQPSYQAQFQIDRADEHYYTIVLPASPYQQLGEYLANSNAAAREYGDGLNLVFHASGVTDSPSHWTFDVGASQHAMLTYSGPMEWVGALPGIIPQAPKDYRIVSYPKGATITFNGSLTRWMTNIDLAVPETALHTIVLRKENYADCGYAPERDTKNEYGEWLFECVLKEVRNAAFLSPPD